MIPFGKMRTLSSEKPVPDELLRYGRLKRAYLLRLLLLYLAPLMVVTTYFFFQYDAVVREASRVRLESAAESRVGELDLFMSERVVKLANLLTDEDFQRPPTTQILKSRLDRLKRQSDAFVDLSVIDSSGVQTAYAGPFPSLQGRRYRTQSWYRKLEEQESDYLISDIYLGYRMEPHFTIAVRRRVEGKMAVLRGTLDPNKIYDLTRSSEKAHGFDVFVVNRGGLPQLVLSSSEEPLENYSVVPPESPRAGSSPPDGKTSASSYAYAWLRTADWAVIVREPRKHEWSVFGLRLWLVGLLPVIVLFGLLVLNTRAAKLVEGHLETERTKSQLAKRVKELDCLFGIDRLVERPGITLEEFLRAAAELVRKAWQYPEITCARVLLQGKEYKTSLWKETEWKQACDIVIAGNQAGRLEVLYMEEKPPRDEGPFLSEERDLLDAVAKRLGRIIGRMWTEERRNMLATAVERSAECILITDTQGTIEYANPAFTKISGYTLEEVIGENPRILKSGAQDRSFYQSLWKTILSGRVWEGRITNRRKNGSLYEAECWISPVRGERGDIIRFVAVTHDVTEMIRLENELRQAQKMEAIGQLAGGVAHDFNNILTVILSNAHYLAKEIGPSDPMRRDVEEIRQAGQRAASLTRQLLAFSRQQVVEPQRLDLNQVLADTENMLRHLIDERIVLRTVPGSHLDPVYEDPSQLQQIILNLAVNARDAMPDGGELTLETSNVRLDRERHHLGDAVEPGPYVMLKVTDNGRGMAPATRDRIFEPFFTTKEQGKGTGLGLSTVYGIVTQGGGHITVESEVDKGTTFEIFFRSASDTHLTESEIAP